MNHFCTYFDSGFLLQGGALWLSLKQHDPEAVLWVLALDEGAVSAMKALAEERLRVVTLSELEAYDAELAAVKSARSPVEYMFTLSPCLPRWLLRTQPSIERIVYLDADLCFFASPDRVLREVKAHGASVAITEHKFPPQLRHLEQHGRFNVGFQVFVGDAPGLAVLDDWRTRCLLWCFDRIEDGRYADQKYLDAWPADFEKSVHVIDDPGVNLAPWNWLSAQLTVSDTTVSVAGSPLVAFHFARFRPLCGTWWWHSGQVHYGVMSAALRAAIYGAYWRWLVKARAAFSAVGVRADFRRRAHRWGPGSLHMVLVRAVFGSDWFRLGDRFIFGRGRFGALSGRYLAWVEGRRAESSSGRRALRK